MTNVITLPAPETIAEWRIPALTDYRPCRWVSGLGGLRSADFDASNPQIKSGRWTAIDYTLPGPAAFPDFRAGDTALVGTTQTVNCRVIYHHVTAMLLIAVIGDRRITVPLSLGWGSTSDANGLRQLAPGFSMSIAYKPRTRRSLPWGATEEPKPRKARPERPATIRCYA